MWQDLVNSIKSLGSAGGGVTLNSLLAGEDVANDVMKVEMRNTSSVISTAATISILKSTAGLLHAVNVGMLSNPTITIFDNASGASGTILLHVEPQGLGSPGNYLVDVSFVNGATAYLTGGNSPRVTASIR